MAYIKALNCVSKTVKSFLICYLIQKKYYSHSFVCSVNIVLNLLHDAFSVAFFFANVCCAHSPQQKCSQKCSQRLYRFIQLKL